MNMRTTSASLALLALTWSGVVVVQGRADSTPIRAVVQATTNDGIYTKAQADGAKAQYDKVCLTCHAFSEDGRKKKEDLLLGSEEFLKKWEGKSVEELVTTTALSMPNDGSAVISEEEALNLIAYVLQQNGFPAGNAPLTLERAAATIARPKK